MARDALEAEVLREDTVRFIEADGDDIVLNRATRTSDGAGGFIDGDPAPLPAQRMRFQPTVSRQSADRVSTAGQVQVPRYELVAKHDADIKRRDFFMFEGARYEVTFVDNTSDYRTIAGVEESGL